MLVSCTSDKRYAILLLLQNLLVISSAVRDSVRKIVNTDITMEEDNAMKDIPLVDDEVGRGTAPESHPLSRDNNDNDEEKGSVLERATGVEKHPDAPLSSPTTSEQQKRSCWLFGLIILLIVVILAVVLGCVFGISDDNDDDDVRTTVSGQIVDIHEREIYPGKVIIENNHIARIEHEEKNSRWLTATPNDEGPYIIPGFVDAHTHIESSLLVPSEFARLAVLHGTVATVSDPHEIANVLGLEGIHYMLENAAQVPFYFFFGAPSCVPATPFETAGAEVTVEDIEELFQDDRIKYLSEMMNYPGVLFDFPDVLAKLQVAEDYNRTIDGHAPGLMGQDALTYIQHGISTDHESFRLDEAQDKLAGGMKILIREGSASRNFDTLHPIIASHPDQVMFCTDDIHADMLVSTEIDYHVRRSVQFGYDVFDVLRIASKNPVEHYGLPVGLLRPGDSADFVLVDNLVNFTVLETWIKGQKVASKGNTLIESAPVSRINNFGAVPITETEIARNDTDQVRVIVAFDGLIVTSEELLYPTDPDVLKIVVVNRYDDTAPPAVAYIKGFGLKQGALASSVAHDSHNIVAVGVSDKDIVNAVNGIIDLKGGLAVSSQNSTEVLPLPIAGLMSDDDAYKVAKRYKELDSLVKQLGSTLQAPFMTLSFMALLVIPDIKISDMGLFDGRTFEFVDVAI